MMVYMDAEACPATGIAESVAKRHEIPVMLLCEIRRVPTSDYSTVKISARLFKNIREDRR